MPNVLEMNEKFGTPGVVRFDAGNGGLPRIVVTAEPASAEIYLHGAHVTGYKPRGGQPILFISEQSMFAEGKPIRGGVPLVFPWFGARADSPQSPAHGFARLRIWQLEACDVRSNGSVRIVLTDSSDDSTRALWPGEFQLRFIVVISESLDMTLEVRNTGKQAFKFEEAMHSYLSVGDARKVTIDGLENASYLDRLDPTAKKTQAGPIRFTGETDRVYMNTKSTCVLRDPELQRTLTVEKEGSDATVVWNPWVAKAKAMPDFGDTEWPQMTCIETANVMECAVKLGAGETHRMQARIGTA